jgi:hypothetical protein
MADSMRKTLTYILSFLIYLVILTIVAFVVHTGYPKVKGILYPPPHVSLSVVGVNLEGAMVAVSLTGDAEFCKKYGRLTIETTLVGTDHKHIPLSSPPNFLTKTSDGAYADVSDVTIKTEDQEISDTAYLPFDIYLGGDLSKPFCVRVRIFDGRGNVMNTFYTAPKQLGSAETPVAAPPGSPAPASNSQTTP